MARTLALLTALIWTGSCRFAGSMPPDGRPVREVYAEPSARDVQLHAHPSPLRTRKILPVLSPPEVFAVYVPSHVNRSRDLLVGEHWLFFKLQEADWFIRRERERDPPASGPADPADWERLRALPEEKWNAVLVPHGGAP